MPRLNRDLAVARGLVDPALLALPEKAAQFGTGAFLRGFVDFFVDAANRAGTFGGRVVAIGSTGSGRDRVLEAQDGLYTLAAQGIVDGEVHEEQRVIASVSRALSARDEWERVLDLARTPDLAVVFSNTTEVGIALDESDRPDLAPPRSFPGKLTAFLHARAVAFDFDPTRGVVVLPCELIEDNGATLRAIVRELAHRWSLGTTFTEWLDAAVPFCNTLVDRIVPGAPTGDDAERLRNALGYEDGLLTTCEPYRLFAVERPAGGDADAVLDALARADDGVVIVDDIAPYRERKVRLLNGTHTAMVPTALLAGCETVREAMEHPRVGPFVRHVLFDEIVPTLTVPGAAAFARTVVDRFSNPFIRHALFDITLQGTMKTRVRLVPIYQRYAARFGEAPTGLAFGFAAYLLLLRGDLQARRRDAGLTVPADDQGERIAEAWRAAAVEGPDAAGPVVDRVAGDATLWDADLAALPGFRAAVATALADILRDGVPTALDALLGEVPDARRR